jgi:uncharacterized protein (TIGR02996 family)
VRSDADALFAAVVANPDEDTPRLMYADEIEGVDPARAWYIREAVLRQLPPDVFPPGVVPAVLVRDAGGVPQFVPLAEHRPGFGYAARRGFVEAVSCTAGDWLAHGPAVVRGCPTLRRVELADLEPYTNNRTRWSWYDAGRGGGTGTHPASDVPRPLWARLLKLKGDLAAASNHGTSLVWLSEAAARDALSAAALACARDGGA